MCCRPRRCPRGAVATAPSPPVGRDRESLNPNPDDPSAHPLETQEDRRPAQAAERGWTGAGVHREVHSGADLFGRPGLTRVRESLRGGEADVLLAYALDRLSWKQTHVAIVADECETAGARLAFVTEDFEEGPVGTSIRGARAFAAEPEREKILERTMRGRRRRVEDGRPLPGLKALYGYRWTDGTGSRLEEDPIAAPVVRRVLANALEGVTRRMIAKRLSDEGLPTPPGRSPIRPVATIYDLLQNPTYTGKPVAFRTRTVRVGGKRRSSTIRRRPHHWRRN